MIPEDRICFLVEGIVESMDFTSFDIKYSVAGLCFQLLNKNASILRQLQSA